MGILSPVHFRETCVIQVVPQQWKWWQLVFSFLSYGFSVSELSLSFFINRFPHLFRSFSTTHLFLFRKCVKNQYLLGLHLPVFVVFFLNGTLSNDNQEKHTARWYSQVSFLFIEKQALKGPILLCFFYNTGIKIVIFCSSWPKAIFNEEVSLSPFSMIPKMNLLSEMLICNLFSNVFCSHHSSLVYCAPTTHQ